jgi:DNA-binding CsgD family transcriptional regulator/tetratricopeptide (TPR) repeat protein
VRDLLCPVLVGREREWDAVADALAVARDGRGGLVFLAGEAGAGKSRLCREAAARADAEGMLVLAGRAVRRDSPLPYRPLTDALLPVAGTIDHDAAELGPFGRALDRILPATAPDAPPTPHEVDEREPLVCGEAIVRLLRAVAAGRGCLLVLEDIHWADPETLAVLEYLADHIDAEPITCLATLRTDEASPARELAARLAERRAASVVRLDRLDDARVAEMVRACLRSDAPAEILSFVTERAEGLPFLVEELLAGLAGSDALVHTGEGWQVGELVPTVPSTFADTVRGRLSRLDPEAQRVIGTAALLGRDFDWTLVAHATGLDEGVVLSTLRACVDAQLVGVTGPQRFRFRHALSRDVVTAEIMPHERASLSASAVAAIEQAHPGLDGDWCELAAELAEASGNRGEAARLALEVARRALERGALGSAELSLERTKRLAAGDALLTLACDESLARTWAAAGEVDNAMATGHDVLAALAATGAAPDRRAQLHITLARAAIVAGRWGDAARSVADAGELAGQNAEIAMHVAALGAQVAIALGRPDEALALATEAAGRATRANAPAVACEAFEVIGRVHRGTDVAHAEEAFEKARALAERNALPLWRARALHELGTIDLYTVPRPDRFVAAREAAVEAGAPSIVALADLHLAVVGHALWRPDEGVEAARRCIDLSRRLGLATLPMALIHLGASHAMRGDERAMDAACAEAVEEANGALDVLAGVPGRAHATLALRRADFAAARRHLDEAITILETDPSIAFPFRGLWALMRTAEGADDGAARRAAAIGAGAAGEFNRLMLGVAEAVALGRAGRADEAAASYAAADPEARLVGTRPWSAIVERIVAGAALRDGWGEPVAWLLECLAVFEDEGLEELASSCRALLREAGAKVPRRGRGEAEVPQGLRAAGVTSREVDVLRLLAERLSNREIAARLHLSPRTVEHHVASLLTKTGAADRSELASLAVREGVAAG